MRSGWDHAVAKVRLQEHRPRKPDGAGSSPVGRVVVMSHCLRARRECAGGEQDAPRNYLCRAPQAPLALEPRPGSSRSQLSTAQRDSERVDGAPAEWADARQVNDCLDAPAVFEERAARSRELGPDRRRVVPGDGEQRRAGDG